jgi:hypothetical protein
MPNAFFHKFWDKQSGAKKQYLLRYAHSFSSELLRYGHTSKLIFIS